MAVGESAAFAVKVLVACPFDGAGVTMTAMVQTATSDPNPADNTASAFTAVSNPVPTISGAGVDRSTLWPPNHQMVDVEVMYTVTVSCAITTTTLSIASNEGGGADYQVVDAHHVRLRAERSGGDYGRVYTITIAATTDNKTVTRRTVTVTVPHDQSEGK
jgi:hypothetical protein